MNEDENDKQLWQLLGKAKRPDVSPFFARNVLRALREEQQEKAAPAPFVWLRWSWRAALAGAVAVVVCGLAVVHTDKSRQGNGRPNTLLTQQVIEDPDYEVINQLDELLAYEENSVWLDDSLN